MKLFTIFGNPVIHSKSPRMHNLAFKYLGLNNYCYTKTLLTNGEDIVKVFKKLKISGASVTVPHKEWAFKLADEVRGIAKEIGAVNCLIEEEGRVIGYNTDAEGFIESIKEFNYESVLIIGAGGTSKALSKMFKNVETLNRSENRLRDFKNYKTYTWDSFDKTKKYDLIINTTSAGLNDNNLPTPKPILEDLFKNATYAVDVIYHETPFQRLAKENNLKLKDGSDMLVYQGVLQFEKFVDIKIDRENIAKIMKESLKL